VPLPFCYDDTPDGFLILSRLNRCKVVTHSHTIYKTSRCTVDILSQIL
jgi:hypothetical protein